MQGSGDAVPPDWVPQVAPDFCPTCGVYWECEHGIITSTIEIPPGPTRRLSPEEFAKLDTGKFEPKESNPWASDGPLGKRLGAALDRQFAEMVRDQPEHMRRALDFLDGSP